MKQQTIHPSPITPIDLDEMLFLYGEPDYLPALDELPFTPCPQHSCTIGSESRPKAPDAARIAAVRQMRIGLVLYAATVALALWFIWAEVKR